MLKYLLLIALALVIWWGWQKRARAAAELPRRESAPERMLACTHCGVHFPESEGLAANGGHYCCEAHRRAGPKTR